MIKERQNVVDNFRNFARAMAPRARHFLHDGRFHPHFAGFGDCRRPDSSHSRSKAGRMIAETNR